MRSKYLDETICCIAAQTYLPNEIIVVNNGIGKVHLSDCGLSIKHIQTVYRAGVAQARNIGATAAVSDYVAFIDDDDLWSPDYLEIMTEKIGEDNPDALIARLDQLVDGRMSTFKNAHGLIQKEYILKKNPGITGSTVVVRKQAFLTVGGYNPQLTTGEDKALILEFICRGLKVITVPECQAIMRQHRCQDRLTSSASMAEGLEQFYRLYKKQMNFNQMAVNLLKMNKYRWESKKSFISLIGIVIFAMPVGLERGLSRLYRTLRLEKQTSK